MALSLEDPLLPDKWNQPCCDNHLVHIAEVITDWQELAPYLGLTQVDEENIIHQYHESLPCQRRQMLRIWHQRNGSAATYKDLASVFQHCSRQDLVDKIGELISIDSRSGISLHSVQK